MTMSKSFDSLRWLDRDVETVAMASSLEGGGALQRKEKNESIGKGRIGKEGKGETRGGWIDTRRVR